MSFREVRSFAETMRLLGYPHLISMESFKKPNVELVANCVYWLIKRYEPSAEVSYNIELESDRVFFFKQVCQVALAKGRIKLNIKKLYESNGHAVQEMLKLAAVLKKAMRTVNEDDLDFAALQQMAAQKNVNDAKQVQKLCSDITADGSSLFFLIDTEMSSKDDRNRVLSRATEVGEFERRLRELLASVSQQVEVLQQSITNLTADESNLEQKIENKKTQLERAQKRYKSLLQVRPQFVEEYDKHEAELQSQFVKYLEQYRNLEYLEHELAMYNAFEDAMLEEQETKLKVMRERLRKEELKSLRDMKGSGRGQEGGSGDGGDSPGAASAAIMPRSQEGINGFASRHPMTRGSSEDEDDSDEGGSSAEAPPRPPNALGRSRAYPGETPGLEMDNAGTGGMNGGRPGVDLTETTPAQGAAPSTGPSSMRPNQRPPAAYRMMDSDDDDDDDDDDDTSDISSDSSDISFDSGSESDI